MASAMMLPMVSSLLAEMVPTWAISFWSFVGLGDLLELLDDRLDGLVDAALDVHRVAARGHDLGAFAVDGLGQNGGGGGAVAGDVGGLAMATSRDHLGAHVFELVLEFDFLGDRDAVLGDVGGAEGLLDDDVTALGAEGDLDRIRQGVDAVENGLSSHPRHTAEFSHPSIQSSLFSITFSR